jgi:sec-independent protein translocase protein TatC
MSDDPGGAESDATGDDADAPGDDAGFEFDGDVRPADDTPTSAAREGQSVVSEPEATDDLRAEMDLDPEAAEPTPPVTGGETVAEEPVETADGGVTRSAVEPTDSGDGLLGGAEGGPDQDVEMPLTDHIEEMINRLAVVLLVGGVVALAVFPVADQLINYLWNTHIPGAATIADRRPRLYGPLELPLTEIKIAALAGLLVGLPVLVYQSYRFMRPGLYPRERRYYLAAVPTSLVLATVGVAFAHFVVLPAIFAYFTSYTTGTALVAFGLRETFNLLLMGYMAVVFQIPLLIQLGIMMGLVSREWLEARRLLFWGGFAGLSFLVSPDPTGMAPIIVAATMIALFEGTLTLLRWTGN